MRASRSNPSKQLTLLLDVDLELAAVQRSVDRAGCERTLREASAAVVKLRLGASETRHYERAISRLRVEPGPDVPIVTPVERFRHARFGDGTLVAREVSGLRIRFDDGVERVLKTDRVAPA